MESCIFNEFAKEQISNLIILMMPHINYLFPEVQNISEIDFLAFFNKFSDENHSQIHSDESHITLSICLNEEFDGGEFIFNNGNVIVKQTPFNAIIFMGSIPHYTNDTKGNRYNLIIYLKQKSKNDNFYDKQYIEYLSYTGIRNISNCSNCDDKKNVMFIIPEIHKLRLKKLKSDSKTYK